MMCRLDWHGPEDPGPDLAVNDYFEMPWVDPPGWYAGIARGGPDEIRAIFNLDELTGDFLVYLEAWRGPTNLHWVTTAYFVLPVDEHIDWHLQGLYGVPDGHTITGHFTTEHRR